MADNPQSNEQQSKAILGRSKNAVKPPSLTSKVANTKGAASRASRSLAGGVGVPLKKPGSSKGSYDFEDHMRGKALSLAKGMATGQRDRSKPVVKQLAGEAGARTGQIVGGLLGTEVPFLGNLAGAAIGKRLGRVAGENPLLFILVIFIVIVVSLLPIISFVFLVLDLF